jgi:inorganic pyrophosphatase
LLGGCSIRMGDEPAEDKLLGAVICDPTNAELTDLRAVDDKLKARISDFFRTYKENEAQEVTVDGWYDRLAAIDKVKAGLRAAAKKRRKG